MKYIYPLCASLILSLLITGCKKDNTSPNAPEQVFNAPANFRVVGYIQDWEIQQGMANTFDMARLNYLNIAFESMDASGEKFPDFTNLDATIAAAHKANVKVLGTIGSGIDISLIAPANRAGFIDSLMSTVNELNLDGIDVDLEGSTINQNYEGFVGDLSVALHAKNKVITAAIATWERDSFTDKALSYFDYLNVMTYDRTGPWDPNDPGPDSPYPMAVSDLAYWGGTRAIPAAKLNLGLPFYGYGFGAGTHINYTYAQIVKKYPGSERRDMVIVPDGGRIYYNGIPTIQQKCKLAQTEASGVMIWEIMQDATDQKSLLTAIDSTLSAGK